MTEYVRGEQVTFSTIFRDASGNVITPASASVSVCYDSPAGRQTTSQAMLPAGGGAWTAIWDSSVALPGVVDWFISSASAKCVDEGSFDLAANDANPDPV